MKSKVKDKHEKTAQPVKKAVAKKERRGRSSTSRISSKNQVTIPVEVLRLTNLEIGDEVIFTFNDNGALEVKKVVPVNPFQEFADAMGDTYVGFDLAKERAESWD